MTGSDVIAIRDVRAARGESARGFLHLGESVGGPLQVPLVIINGAGAGPVLCLTAGVHATEYEPIDALMRLLREIDPKRLRGAVIAVPVVNMPMYQSRTAFISPIDGLNLNKIAPGNAGGSISEILAHTLLDEVISAASVHIDLHAGDVGELLWPFAGYPLTGHVEQDRMGEAVARMYSPALISLASEGSSLPPFASSIVFEAARRGVVSVLVESGGDGLVREADVRTHIEGVQNVMRCLGMIDGAPHVAEHWLRATDRFVMRARHAGYVRLQTAIGDHAAQGQKLAEICNVFGDVVDEVRSSRPGIVGLIWTRKVVNTGDPIVRCWAVESAPPFPLTAATADMAAALKRNAQSSMASAV